MKDDMDESIYSITRIVPDIFSDFIGEALCEMIRNMQTGREIDWSTIELRVHKPDELNGPLDVDMLSNEPIWILWLKCKGEDKDEG